MPSKKKKRVFFEDIKARHTTHWDMDYLSRAELDALYRRSRNQSHPEDHPAHRRLMRRSVLKAVLAAAITLLVAAVALLPIL